jgi:prolyl-tRNA synthetase
MVYMGYYGISFSRLADAAAIKQNFGANGIGSPEPTAPFHVAVWVINPKKDPKVADAAEVLYSKHLAEDVQAVLDDRGLAWCSPTSN